MLSAEHTHFHSSLEVRSRRFGSLPGKSARRTACPQPAAPARVFPESSRKCSQPPSLTSLMRWLSPPRLTLWRTSCAPRRSLESNSVSLSLSHKKSVQRAEVTIPFSLHKEDHRSVLRSVAGLASSSVQRPQTPPRSGGFATPGYPSVGRVCSRFTVSLHSSRLSITSSKHCTEPWCKKYQANRSSVD